MAGMKSLAKDTAIYGLSSILGRFLNWCFVFLYINVLKTTAEYGIVTNLYAYMALLLIILTYGMETGFFRFANDKEEKEPQRVYTTGLISLATTSTLFFVLVWVFITPLSRLLGYPEHEDYVLMMAAIIAVDAFTALPFAYLRYRRRPIRFASIKLFSIFLNIALNLFFILLCPPAARRAGVPDEAGPGARGAAAPPAAPSAAVPGARDAAAPPAAPDAAAGGAACFSGGRIVCEAPAGESGILFVEL